MAIILGIIVTAGALVSLWLIPIYRKLSSNEKAIRAKEDEIDAVELNVTARTIYSPITASQLQAQVENQRKPLRRELERLEQERRFLLEKLPFFKR